MIDSKVIHRKLRLLNSSACDLEVWLEWEVLTQYKIAPGQQFFVHALTCDFQITQGAEPEWSIFVDAVNNAISVYMPGELRLAEDFYLTDCETFERIAPVAN